MVLASASSLSLASTSSRQSKHSKGGSLGNKSSFGAGLANIFRRKKSSDSLRSTRSQVSSLRRRGKRKYSRHHFDLVSDRRLLALHLYPTSTIRPSALRLLCPLPSTTSHPKQRVRADRPLAPPIRYHATHPWTPSGRRRRRRRSTRTRFRLCLETTRMNWLLCNLSAWRRLQPRPPCRARCDVH